MSDNEEDYPIPSNEIVEINKSKLSDNEEVDDGRSINYSDDDDNDVEKDDDNDDDSLVDNLIRKSNENNIKKKRKLGLQKKTKKKSKRSLLSGYNFFNEEAHEADDSEEEMEEYEEGVDQVLDKDELAAREAVDRRHQANRGFLERSAEEIAEELEQRHRSDVRMKKSYGNQENLINQIGNVAVAQQSLLPSILDPKIFKLKVKPGNELVLVRSIMLKAIDVRNKGGLLKIKSVFCSSCKGFIYIEALSEAFAKEIIQGLRMIYGSSFSQVPVSEMTSVLSATVKTKPIKEGQWVRLKRGPLKGDLARVISLFEGGSKAFIQVVPRPDYNFSRNEKDKKTLGVMNTKIRPQQRLFDVEELKMATGILATRTSHPFDQSDASYDMWGNEYYKDGFQFKDVNISTYLDQIDVKPRIEELQMFRQRRIRPENDENDEIEEIQNTSNSHFMKELADQIANIGENEEKEGTNPFLPGDLVQVTSGDLRNLIARIVSTNDANGVARIIPFDNASLNTEISIEINLLVKHIFPGAHIKVVGGRYMGQTGRVVSVVNKDGDTVAAILTDGINTEIECNVGHLQMSSEVTTGYGNLCGYELYDLVALSDNGGAVVIIVGTEKLRVIDQSGNLRDVLPSELKGKRNNLAPKLNFDIQQNEISLNDTVKVTTGPHAKQSGTVKQMFKGTLWLHSNSYLKNSGIFVVKNRSCLVAGGKVGATPPLSASYKGVLLPPNSAQNTSSIGQSTLSRVGGSGGGPNKFGGGRDNMIGKTIRITSGANKGLLAQVVDATPTHYSVELLAKLKRIVVERVKTIPAGDKNGSLEMKEKNTYDNKGADTPYLTGATPMYDGAHQTPRNFIGAGTPMHFGNETPGYSVGNSTPYNGSATPRTDYWNVNESDRNVINSTSSMDNAYGSSYGSNKGWEDSISGSSYRMQSGDNSVYSQAYSHTQSITGSQTPMTLNSMSNEVGSIRSETSGVSIHNNSMLSSKNATNITTVPTVPPITVGGDITFKEWTVNMVVNIKKGTNTGKLAVIQQKANDHGVFHVYFRDGAGKLIESQSHNHHYSEIDLAVPGKKEKVIIVSGNEKGMYGIVQTIKNTDVFLKLQDDEELKIFRMNRLAWINTNR